MIFRDVPKMRSLVNGNKSTHHESGTNHSLCKPSSMKCTLCTLSCFRAIILHVDNSFTIPGARKMRLKMIIGLVLGTDLPEITKEDVQQKQMAILYVCVSHVKTLIHIVTTLTQNILDRKNNQNVIPMSCSRGSFCQLNPKQYYRVHIILLI